jgi:hypothetical protein
VAAERLIFCVWYSAQATTGVENSLRSSRPLRYRQKVSEGH